MGQIVTMNELVLMPKSQCWVIVGTEHCSVPTGKYRLQRCRICARYAAKALWGNLASQDKSLTCLWLPLPKGEGNRVRAGWHLEKIGDNAGIAMSVICRDRAMPCLYR